MNKNKVIALACIMGIPFVGFSDVTINAYAQDGAIAYLYDTSGTTYGTTTFSGGQAIISTSGLVGISDYGLAMSYMPGQNWYSNIAWANGGGGSQFKPLFSGSTYEVKGAVTGAVTSRSLVGSNASVTFSANGPTGIYDNETNELDAELVLYRPVASVVDFSDAPISRTWNGAGLGSEYGWEVSDAGYLGLSLITLTNNTGSFYAEYVGNDLGGGNYDLFFLGLERGTAFLDGSIVSNGNEVVFSVTGLGTGIYDDMTPYYLMMDRAWIYDDDGNYSEAYDTGMSLTTPDHYVIPEPTVMALLAMTGSGMLIVRRFLIM